MSILMTRDEARGAMAAQGIPPHVIERALNEQYGPETTVSFVQPAGDVLHFPIRLTLPWTTLCSDNFRHVGSLTMRDGKPIPRMKLTARYKAARDKTRSVARAAMQGFPPLTLELSLHARVYVPNSNTYDVCNFAKCSHDALETIVYRNDSQLLRTTWERVGIDVDHPRAEIEVLPR